MNMFWLLVSMLFYHGVCISSSNTNVNVSTKTRVVKVGAIFSFNSSVGKVAHVAIKAAIEDVNDDPTILNGTTLKLAEQDSKLDNEFLGIVEGIFSVTSPFCSFTNFHPFHDAQVIEFHTVYIFRLLLKTVRYFGTKA